MKSRSALKAVYTVLFVVLVFAIRVFADDVPTFSDPDVNTYVTSWSKLNRDWFAAASNWETVDNQTMLELVSRTQELATQAAQVARKVKSGEKEKFTQYMTQCFHDFDDFNNRLKKSMSEATGVQGDD